jgi:cytochrome o ubiquinol oxidase subunit 2
MKIPKQAKIAIIVAAGIAFAGIIGLGAWFLSNHNVAVLNPAGTIADQQRQLIITATLLMAIVVVPVLAMTFAIAWRYRAGNTKARYSPELTGNKWAEAVWWLIPFAIIVGLASIVVVTSHSLDPFKPLASTKKPLRVQVISLQWKWLFLYPDLHVASVNYLPVPTDTPLDFQLTSDAPMNSFWIPQLGGQIYTMSGMSTQLHLMASKPGDYKGSSANISGAGFAGMTFMAHATSQADFDSWVKATANSGKQMTLDSYAELTKPSENVAPTSYAFPAAYDRLYDTVIMKYMSH